jgi:hypothetical protein
MSQEQTSGTKRVTRAPVVSSGKEVNTEDFNIPQPSPIVLTADGPIVREPEEIVALDAPLENDYAAALAFMEEKITIIVNPSSEKFAQKLIDVGVNGRAEWIEVGKMTRIARKYVEVLARTRPTDIQTKHDDATAETPNNTVVRFSRVKHPFSVVGDTSPRGQEWLARLMAEQ